MGVLFILVSSWLRPATLFTNNLNAQPGRVRKSEAGGIHDLFALRICWHNWFKLYKFLAIFCGIRFNKLKGLPRQVLIHTKEELEALIHEPISE